MLTSNTMPRRFTRRHRRAHHRDIVSPTQPHDSAAPIPLSLVAPGETVTLTTIQDCARLRQRIADLGLNIGLTVRVVKNDFHGPLILAVKHDTRLAIGRGLARRIRVHPGGPNNNSAQQDT
ncbi:MAG: ferrous iron transport protein A [Chloroflexi bacterium]|nr:ferrous iron transport protein A [Chloroflexota bacterium]